MSTSQNKQDTGTSLSTDAHSYELAHIPFVERGSQEPPLLVAYETTRHSYKLDRCHLSGPAAEKMSGLKKWHDTAVGKWQKVVTFFLCKKPYIAIGKLGSCSSSAQDHLESQSPRETQFEDMQRNHALTRGFTRPSSFVDSPDLVTRIIASCQDHATPDSERHAVVVGLEVDKNKVVFFMLLMASCGLLLGVSVAVVTHNTGLGVAVGAGVFTFVALLQSAVTWKCI